MNGWIIFAGGAYWLVEQVPKISDGADFVIVRGRKWVKSKREFKKKDGPFACPRGFQVLTEADARAQGLVS